MNCPICKDVKLSQTLIHNVEVDYCPKCLGMWFEQDELRQAKDNKDKNLGWLDVDLWENQDKFKASYGIRHCPACRVPLYEVYYGDSGVVIDVCKICKGVWLDRAEFKKIVQWLKDKADYEIMHNYSKNLVKEFAEIFVGPEELREEISDFLTILRIFSRKFGGEHTLTSDILLNLPK